MVKFKHNEPHFELQLGEIKDGVLRVLSFEGEDAISRPFEYRIELLSDDPEIDPAKILNKPATFVWNRGDEDPVKIESMRRRAYHSDREGSEPKKKFLVYFAIEKVLPLVGTGE